MYLIIRTVDEFDFHDLWSEMCLLLRKKAKIEKVHIKTLSKSLYTSPEGDANDTWTEKDLPRKKAPKKNDKDSLSSFAPASNSPAIPFNGYIYDVAVTRNENLSKLENIDANLLR